MSETVQQLKVSAPKLLWDWAYMLLWLSEVLLSAITGTCHWDLEHLGCDLHSNGRSTDMIFHWWYGMVWSALILQDSTKASKHRSGNKAAVMFKVQKGCGCDDLDWLTPGYVDLRLFDVSRGTVFLSKWRIPGRIIGCGSSFKHCLLLLKGAWGEAQPWWARVENKFEAARFVIHGVVAGVEWVSGKVWWQGQADGSRSGEVRCRVLVEILVICWQMSMVHVSEVNDEKHTNSTSMVRRKILDRQGRMVHILPLILRWGSQFGGSSNSELSISTAAILPEKVRRILASLLASNHRMKLIALAIT